MNAWGLLSAAIIVATTCVAVGAEVQAPSNSGRVDFETYCSSCHGAGARGDGPFAKSLKKPPADLTLISKGNNGVFPDARVFKTIDGPQAGGAHTASAMPAWGDVLAKSTNSQGADNAAVRIHTLVEYLRTIQAKP